jgi:hypothetical protein
VIDLHHLADTLKRQPRLAWRDAHTRHQILWSAAPDPIFSVCREFREQRLSDQARHEL